MAFPGTIYWRETFPADKTDEFENDTVITLYGGSCVDIGVH